MCECIVFSISKMTNSGEKNDFFLTELNLSIEDIKANIAQNQMC